MKRVVAFGELMLRLSPPGQERFFQSPTLRTWFGGSEANVAASLAHMGVQSEYVTRLPANPVGDAALAALRAEGMGLAHVQRGGDRLGIYYVESGADLRGMRVVYDRAHSAFSQIDPATLDWPAILRGAHWLHLSGITPALGAGPAAAAADAARSARSLGVPVSVDLNYRPALWAGRDPRPLVRPLVEGCDVLIGNPGAITAMLGVQLADHDAGSPEALQRIGRQLEGELQCRRLVVTKREVLSASEHGWSASVCDAANACVHTSERYQVRVVDRVGGGDSFVAGLVYAILDARPLADALRFATAASALKLTVPGDFNRVTVAEVDRLLGG
jgi:2-dehydro-3-deoxygluconokinase